MKIFKTAFLGMVFLCGLTAMSSIDAKEKTSNETVMREQESLVQPSGPSATKSIQRIMLFL